MSGIYFLCRLNVEQISTLNLPQLSLKDLMLQISYSSNVPPTWRETLRDEKNNGYLPSTNSDFV
jgi:hypothetical protein